MVVPGGMVVAEVVAEVGDPALEAQAAMVEMA
jgi:hypothetical protein